MSRMHSRQIADITIRTESRTYHFKAMDWSIELDQARVDVSHMGSPNLAWISSGPARGRLEFCILDSNLDVTPDEEVDMRLAQLKRYMSLLNIPDDV
jgi:hypothetical protein